MWPETPFIHHPCRPSVTIAYTRRNGVIVCTSGHRVGCRNIWIWVTVLYPLVFQFNFHPLEGVDRYRDPQLQVGEIYSHLSNLRPNIYNSVQIEHQFIFYSLSLFICSCRYSTCHHWWSVISTHQENTTHWTCGGAMLGRRLEMIL